METSEKPMMRRELLALHRALVESERREYERTRGRVTDRAFLEALIGAPELAWLNPLTSLIVRLEEAVEENAAETARGASEAPDGPAPTPSGKRSPGTPRSGSPDPAGWGGCG